MSRTKLRIGIYVGAFDPVHAGHIAFALEAMQLADLDQVIFLPERRPRANPSPEHYAHRVAMLKTAILPHRDLAVMEVVDSRFSVLRTLPQLRQLFPQATTVFLAGADGVVDLASWRYVERMFAVSELVVRLKDDQERPAVEATLAAAHIRPRRTFYSRGPAADVSSNAIRQAIRTSAYTPGLLASVQRYAKREWLYVSPGYHVRKIA